MTLSIERWLVLSVLVVSWDAFLSVTHYICLTWKGIQDPQSLLIAFLMLPLVVIVIVLLGLPTERLASRTESKLAHLALVGSSVLLAGILPYLIYNVMTTFGLATISLVIWHTTPQVLDWGALSRRKAVVLSFPMIGFVASSAIWLFKCVG